MKKIGATTFILTLLISGIVSGPAFGEDGLFIDQSGKVGLGTASPGNKLQIEGPNYASGSIRINNTANNGEATYWEVGERSYSSTDSLFEINASGTARLTIDENGNMGIGTTSPGEKLDVQGQIIGGFGAQTTSGTLDWNHMTNARSGNGHSLLKGSATNGPGPSGYYHPFSFEFNEKDGNGNLTQFAIPYSTGAGLDSGLYYRGRYDGAWSSWRKILSENADGRVGIGTTNPEATLDVNGNAVISGSLNGEDPPMKFTVGNPHEQSTWLAVEKNVESHCGDDDGCRIKMLLQHETTDKVRTVTVEIFIEQPSISNNQEPGLRGYTRVGDNYEWILGWAGHRYELCHPFHWIWIRNYPHENAYGTRGPVYTGEDIYTLDFQIHPSVTATVIIYDR